MDVEHVLLALGIVHTTMTPPGTTTHVPPVSIKAVNAGAAAVVNLLYGPDRRVPPHAHAQASVLLRTDANSRRGRRCRLCAAGGDPFASPRSAVRSSSCSRDVVHA